ncbi:hypothetical protein HEP81_01038 [Streptomyces griseofuscus]|uniref:Uncharacterized protein n=1 Tax=Streptomyces griseofuscus TaxID=146922 RepID=A0A7H1PTJ2_9ACTN|nr:hypothetical protein HEP81_01038 [Streptomyces griseofuscus]
MDGPTMDASFASDARWSPPTPRGPWQAVGNADWTVELFARLARLDDGPERDAVRDELVSAWLPMAHRIASHSGFHLDPRLPARLGVLGDRGLDAAGEVTPGPPGRLVRLGLLLAPRAGGGRPVLVTQLL